MGTTFVIYLGKSTKINNKVLARFELDSSLRRFLKVKPQHRIA
jgi:hypothetical protein